MIGEHGQGAHEPVPPSEKEGCPQCGEPHVEGACAEQIKPLEPTPIDVLISGIESDDFGAVSEKIQRMEFKVGPDAGQTDFTKWTTHQLTPERIERLRSRFQGQTLVDLGAAESTGGYELARTIGAKAYVGVEPYYADDLLKNIRNFPLRNAEESIKYREELQERMKREGVAIPYAVVPVDMLTFLQSLPDNSVSILAGGIDHTITGEMPTGMVPAISAEMQRVLDPRGGLILISSSGAFGDSLKRIEECSDPTSKETHSGGFRVYSKGTDHPIT